MYSDQSRAPVNDCAPTTSQHHTTLDSASRHIMAADLDSAHEKPAMSEDGHHDEQPSEPDQTAIEQETKDNIVDWDGPDDPQNPRNWPVWKRMAQVVLVSAFLLTAYYVPLHSFGEANRILTKKHTVTSQRQCLHPELPHLLRNSTLRIPPLSVSPCPFTLPASLLGPCSSHRCLNCTDAL